MSTSFEPLAAGGPLAALHLLRLERPVPCCTCA
jgi:hypothetical protein